MIPFPILSSTEIPIRPVLKQFATAMSGGVSFFVDTSGNLFSFGDNTYGQLGTGDTESSYNSWRLVRTDVDKVYAGRVGTIVRLKDGRYFTVGSSSILSGTSPVIGTTWRELVFLSGNDIQDIFIGTDFVIVRINGYLWGAGRNSFGVLNGEAIVPNGSVLTSWSQLSTIQFSSVKLTGGYQLQGIAVGTNTLYACGMNSAKWIDNTLSESAIKSFTIIYAMSTSLILTAYLPHKYGVKISGWNTVNNGYAMYARGWNGEYEFGTRSSGGYDTVSDIGNYYSMKPDSRPSLRYNFSPMDTILYTLFPSTNNAYYICGTQLYGQLSTGNSSVFQGVTNNVAFRNATGLLEIQYHEDCVIYIYADGIYYSGRVVGLNGINELKYITSDRMVAYPNLPEGSTFSFI